MSIEEFNNYRFGAGDEVIYKDEKYEIASVDFEEALIGLDLNISGSDPDTISWVRCENVTIV